MEGMEFYNFFVDYWGRKASNLCFNSEAKGVECTLYDAFPVRCGLGGNHGTFEGGVVTSDGRIVSRYLGKDLSLNRDKESMIKSFEAIDHYCRMRLPDKYLVEYDKIIKT